MAEIELVQSADYDELATFLAGFPNEKRGKDVWISKFRAWWDLNPSFSSAPSRGWLLREQGRIVGFLGTIPIKMQLAGKESLSFGGTTWRVAPEFRGTSMLLKRRQMEDQKDHLHASTTPRREVAKMLELFRYQTIDRGSGTGEQSVIILDFSKFLKPRFNRFAWGNFAVGIGAPLLKSAQSFCHSVAFGRGGRLDVRDISKADHSFDELWDRTRSNYLNTNIRNAEMLNWYCFALKQPEKKLFGCFENDRLLGYMVLLSSLEGEERMLECVDLWLDPSQDEVSILRALVAKAADCGRQSAADRIVFPHYNAKVAALYKKLPLLRRPAWQRREYIKAPPELMEKIVPENSYFVAAQGDYGL